MLSNPKKRICPSVICMICVNMRRQPPGEMNGISPSITSTRAKAVQKVSLSTRVAGLFFGRLVGNAVAAEHLEEFGRGWVEHHHIALLVEAGLVGVQAAVELGELRVTPE